MILECMKKVCGGIAITQEEALTLINSSDQDTPLLLAAADKIRQHFRGNSIDCCAIINGRSGKCSENCRFCAQSGHYHTNSQNYPLLPEDDLVAAAKQANAAGASRFSIVTSGRRMEGEEFMRILTALKRIKKEAHIETCCSLGLITLSQALALKEAGISRYHANIETAPSYFPSVCSTHSFADKASVIDVAQQAGLRVCSGGIFGLGETPAQRIEMAFTLKGMGIDSIPLNILNPIAGTPFETNPPVPPLELLRAFAVFRFILPRALIRTAGGREVNLRSLQPYVLSGGLDGLMIGNYLTTEGRAIHEDLQMIRDLGRTTTHPFIS